MPGLWDYAVKVYAAPGMKEVLLKLQDRYRIDVNVILWCLWAGRYGFRLDTDQVATIQSATADFALHTTVPLRAVRRYLRGPRVGFDREALRRLADDVLRLELMTEELVLRRLEAITAGIAAPQGEAEGWARRSEQLFTLARLNMDIPILIADEQAPESPLGLFREACAIAEDHGP